MSGIWSNLNISWTMLNKSSEWPMVNWTQALQRLNLNSESISVNCGPCKVSSNDWPNWEDLSGIWGLHFLFEWSDEIDWNMSFFYWFNYLEIDEWLRRWIRWGKSTSPFDHVLLGVEVGEVAFSGGNVRVVGQTPLHNFPDLGQSSREAKPNSPRKSTNNMNIFSSILPRNG